MVKDTVPQLLKDDVPRIFNPSINVITPDGTTPGIPDVALAVRVTVCPLLAGFGEAAEAGSQVEGFEGRDFLGQQADAAGYGAALMMDIGAKSSDAFAAEAEVDRLRASQFLSLRDG